MASKKSHIGADSKPEELQLWERLCLAYKVDSISELAESMGLPLGTVKNWKSRGSVPLEYCIQARNQTNRSLDWIILGLDAFSLLRTSKEVDPKLAEALQKEADQGPSDGAPPPLATGTPAPPDYPPTSPVQLPVLLNDVLVVLLETLHETGRVLASDKVARMVELIYAYESMKHLAQLGPVSKVTVRETTDRFLGLLD